MSRRADLTVGQPIDSKIARYWPVAPADAPSAVVTVREGLHSTICLTCYKDNKPYDCPHVAAVKTHLHDQRAGTSSAAA